jgi:beta-fructofuranosidase
MKIEVDLTKSSADNFSLVLRSDDVKETIIIYDLKKQMMYFNRNNADGWSQGISKSPLILKDNESMKIHIYVDQSSIETYTDDYKTNHCCNVFADKTQNKNYIVAHNGEVYIKRIQTWMVESVME